MSWANTSDNRTLVDKTSSIFIQKLKSFLRKKPSTKALREKLWVGFFVYLKSKQYHDFWKSIIELAKTERSPVVFYFVSQYILYELIHQMNKRSPIVDRNEDGMTLSKDEEAALTYVGGYVVRSLIKKLPHKNVPTKEKVMEALLNFKERPEDDDGSVCDTEEVDEDGNIDWMSMCNRGGLFCTKTEFRNFLLSMELVLKTVTRRKITSQTNMKKEMEAAVNEDAEVMFWWEVLCSTVNVDNDTAAILLPLIVELYPIPINSTIYGFIMKYIHVLVFLNNLSYHDTKHMHARSKN